MVKIPDKIGSMEWLEERSDDVGISRPAVPGTLPSKVGKGGKGGKDEKAEGVPGERSASV